MCTAVIRWNAGTPLGVLALRDEYTGRAFDNPERVCAPTSRPPSEAVIDRRATLRYESLNWRQIASSPAERRGFRMRNRRSERNAEPPRSPGPFS
jgi:hypothetical protein